ncbi:MAG: hypothetical protein CVV44_18330 [Spirochaetae bacterium HGW-Spirochaetae-1]|jgi:predicted patatin/cPLA2 family phospholipase|nr:MAG: hypothetical protein CVV44_18330 [Spirochaetae bacterium HGW-Spirochaetae-1]
MIYPWKFPMFSGFKKHKLTFPKKKVLILEGGGMRGIFPTGVLQCFTDRNYFPWKLVIGSSAGALAGTAYIARQIFMARDAFFSKLLKGKFIYLANILSSEKHILDLDWMIDTIVRGREPLDEWRLKKECPVLITATHIRYDGPPETIYLHSKKDDIFTALKATAAIPYLYKGFVEYGGHRFLDGGLLDPIPYMKALEMGFREKDILVVVTRPRGYRKRSESFWIRTLYENYYRDPKYRNLVSSMENRFEKYNKILDDLENRYTGIDVIYPPPKFDVDRLTKDEKKILMGFEQGVHEANRFLLPHIYP